MGISTRSKIFPSYMNLSESFQLSCASSNCLVVFIRCFYYLHDQKTPKTCIGYIGLSTPRKTFITQNVDSESRSDCHGMEFEASAIDNPAVSLSDLNTPETCFGDMDTPLQGIILPTTSNRSDSYSDPGEIKGSYAEQWPRSSRCGIFTG
jgi:hypothetical protein